MPKWIVTQTIKLSHKVNAKTRKDAIAIAQDMGEHTADASSTVSAKKVGK